MASTAPLLDIVAITVPESDASHRVKKEPLADEYNRLFTCLSQANESELDRLKQELALDPVVADVLSTHPYEYVDDLIKIETGQAFFIFIERLDGQKLKVIMEKHLPMEELRRRFVRATNVEAAKQATKAEQTIAPVVNTDYLYKNFGFVVDDLLITDWSKTLASLGIGSGAVVKLARLHKRDFEQLERH